MKKEETLSKIIDDFIKSMKNGQKIITDIPYGYGRINQKNFDKKWLDKKRFYEKRKN